LGTDDILSPYLISAIPDPGIVNAFAENQRIAETQTATVLSTKTDKKQAQTKQANLSLLAPLPVLAKPTPSSLFIKHVNA